MSEKSLKKLLSKIIEFPDKFIEEIKSRWQIDDLDIYEVIEPSQLRKWLTGRLNGIREIVEGQRKKYGIFRLAFIIISGDVFILIPHNPWFLENVNHSVSYMRIKSKDINVALLDVTEFYRIFDFSKTIEELVDG